MKIFKRSLSALFFYSLTLNISYAKISVNREILLGRTLDEHK